MENKLEVEVVIEVPRGSIIKQDASARIDYFSPVPCPFNYGSVDTHIGLDGDHLDAVVLGRRLKRGTRLTVEVQGAVRMSDHGLTDDKLVCSPHSVGKWKRRGILLFFRFYALCKWVINVPRGHFGRNRCLGWIDATAAIEAAEKLPNGRTDSSLP
jgi:inorganic pyrophosphatase